MRIEYAVGPYPSRRARGYIVIVDPVGPVKKCPYDCVYCPLGETVKKTLKPAALTPPNTIIESYRRLLDEIGDGFKAVLIDGLGDPLLNMFIDDIARAIRRENRERGLDVELWIKTTFTPIAYSTSKADLTLYDRVYIILDTGSREDYELINNPLEYIRLNQLARAIRENKLPSFTAEVTLVNIGGEGNWRRESYELLATLLSRSGLHRVIIKTINRPPRSKDVKPAPRRALEKAGEYLGERGFNIEILYGWSPGRYSRSIIPGKTHLYNLVLRRPLTLLELRMIYGFPVNDIAEVIDYLRARMLIEQITWRTHVFYRGIYSL